jgi:hypothetical protein
LKFRRATAPDGMPGRSGPDMPPKMFSEET